MASYGAGMAYRLYITTTLQQLSVESTTTRVEIKL